jgi:RHS repeat-associated protein
VDYEATQDVDITYNYNLRGRLQSVTDSTGTQSYSYDEIGDVLTASTFYTGLPSAWDIYYSYNPNGSRHTMTLPTMNGAGTITYGYDDAGRPTQLTDYSSTPKTFSWQYKTNGLLDRQTLGNGAYTTYDFNTLGQLTGLTNFAADDTTRTAFSNFAYSGLGVPTQVAVSIPGVPALSGTRSWGYDAKGQLTSDQYTGTSAYQHAFGYDNEGNTTNYNGTTLAYDTMNQLTTGGRVYDDNGNPTTYTGGAQLTYDEENRLTAYGTALTAGYTADGLRAWKDGGAGRTYFIYDGLTPVAELKEVDDDWTVSAVNIFGHTGLLARDDARGRTYYQFDATGDVLQRLDEDGDVRSTDRYDAQGNRLNGGETGDPFGYKGLNGYYTDAETGLVLCTYRYYDPSLGRWLTRDPIGYAGGLNVYGYCSNNPISAVDPLGWCEEMTADLDKRNPLEGWVNKHLYGGAVDQLAYDWVGWRWGYGKGHVSGWKVAFDATRVGGTTVITATTVAGAPGVISGGVNAGLDYLASRGAAATEEATTSIFYCGGNLAKDAAEKYAGDIGGTILTDMTAEGRALTEATRGLSNIERIPIDEAASKIFANNASGTVHVFQNANGMGTFSIWGRIEYQELINNPNVTRIIEHWVFEDGVGIIVVH